MKYIALHTHLHSYVKPNLMTKSHLNVKSTLHTKYYKWICFWNTAYEFHHVIQVLLLLLLYCC